MSKFFKNASETESDTESSEEELATQKAPAIVSAFAHSDDDDEEDVKRVVRSAREKRYEELDEIIKKMRNHKKIKDMSNLLASFENLTKAFTKAKPVIEKEENGVTPKFYIRCLVELEAFINSCWEDREGRKNMSKNNSRSLATLRQKIRKYNKDFESEMASYKENPEEEEKEEEKASDDEDEDDDDTYQKKEIKEEVKPKPKPAVVEEPDSDADSIDWGSDSESESSDSTDDEKYGGNLAAKFLKKTPEKEEEAKKAKKKREKREKKQDEDGGEWEEVKGGVPLIMEKPKMFSKDAEITHPVVLRKLNEILAARGKKGTDRSEQIDLLVELLKISDKHNLGPGLGLKIMFAIISAIYDYNANIATCMKPEMWQQCMQSLGDILELLENNTTIQVGEHVAEECEALIVPPYKVRGCILTVVERMDEEFCKILQGCDAHSPEYVERLKDETQVCNIILRLEKYLEEKGQPSEICRIYLRHIDHIYYKYDRNGVDTSLDTMARLAKYIYAKDTTDRIRTQAILFHIFHQALHDNLNEARNLMLMSHLQDSIHFADVPTQILFNRAVVQIGLCCFRHGEIKEAHTALLDIQTGGRAKELLAQGLLPQRQHERTSEQEKIEKRRQIPFHKHINLELLECVYLVSAMLLEIPYMAAHEMDGRKRMISKSYHHQLRNSERQPLVGPPESMREHVVAASKAMRVGNWRACKNYIINDKMNAKVWDLFPQNKMKVTQMITEKIKEGSLRTYLFTYSQVYDSLSIPLLASMFDMPSKSVYSIVSKMMISEDLMASLDEPTQAIVMHRTEPTRIQALALQLADKVNSLTEQNDKLSEMKSGNFFGRNAGAQGGYRDSGYQKSNQQDRNWGRRRPY